MDQQACLDYLKTELESGTLNDEDAKTATAELEDARAVAESIMAEIADARDSAETQKKMKEFMREESQRLEQSGQGTLAGGPGGGEQTVDDLTAFVRKRKHPDTSELQNNENGRFCQIARTPCQSKTHCLLLVYRECIRKTY